MRLRDIMPTGLYARSLLITLLPLLLLIMVMTYVFFDSHIRSINRKLSQHLAGDAALISQFLDDRGTSWLSPDIQDRVRDTIRHQVSVEPGATIPDAPHRTNPFSFFSLDEPLLQELAVSLDKPFWVNTHLNGDQVDIHVQLETGTLRIIADRKRAFATTGHIFIVWVLLLSILLVATALIFMQNQVRSILRLTAAADAFGRGEDAVDFKPSGATEIRDAASAVIAMRDRLTAAAEQRTAMLASISHDLRTPLTRLKLQLALPPDDEGLADARADLNEMAAMLDEYLAFARGEEGESATDTDLGDLLRQIALSFAHRARIEVSAGEAVPSVRVRPLALRRAITNLVQNAADYGETVALSLTARDQRIIIAVEDDGPGIPEDQIDAALRPFSRLDAARNQNEPGVGLGLSIALDIARSHGGDLTLGRSPLGGLSATLTLPGPGQSV